MALHCNNRLLHDSTTGIRLVHIVHAWEAGSPGADVEETEGHIVDHEGNPNEDI